MNWLDNDEAFINRLDIHELNEPLEVYFDIRDTIMDEEVPYITLWLASKYKKIERINNLKIALHQISSWRSRLYKDI